MKSYAKQIIITSLLGIIITLLYYSALTLFFDAKAIERYYLATWGFSGYLLLLSFVGFIQTLKAPFRVSLLCSIGIPFLFVFLAFILFVTMPDLIRIPLFKQNGEYNESIRYGALSFIVFPGSCVVVFALSWLACFITSRNNKRRTI